MLTTRKRVALQDQNKNLLLRKLRKNNIKTLKTDSNANTSVTSVTLRRQFVVNSTAGGALIMTAETQMKHLMQSQIRTLSYQFLMIIVLVVLQKGDLLNLDSSNTSFVANGNVLTITNNTQLNSANIKCKVTTTVTRTASVNTKNLRQLASVCLVDNDGVGGGVSMVHLHTTKYHLVLQTHINFMQS